MKCAQAKSCTTFGSAQQLKQEAGSGAVRHGREGSFMRAKVAKGRIEFGHHVCNELLVLKEGMFLHQEAGRVL